jgi:CheY-specific phosphatase CheX
MTTQSPTHVETLALMERIAEGACKGLFDAYGVTLERVNPQTTPTLPVFLSGIVGFTGPGIRGACLLAASETPILKSNPAGGSLADWIAELANQLVGRIKNKLLVHGADVYATTPIVLRGDHVTPMRRQDITPLVFMGGEGSVFVWIELDTTPAFVLGPPTEVVAEGESVMF